MNFNTNTTDIRNLRTRWINVDKDTEKAEQMVSLLNEHGFLFHKRFSGVTETDEFILDENYGTHMCGLSHRKLLKETILKDNKPVFILEDDVDIEESAIKYKISIPEDADAIYFGISHGDENYSAVDCGNDWLRIKQVFATHAILHINPKYSESVVLKIEDAVERNKPFDVELAYHVQPQFKIYTPRVPFFYQSDGKNEISIDNQMITQGGTNEIFTRKPLILDTDPRTIELGPNHHRRPYWMKVQNELRD